MHTIELIVSPRCSSQQFRFLLLTASSLQSTRVLIEQDSETTIITEKLVQRLRLPWAEYRPVLQKAASHWEWCRAQATLRWQRQSFCLASRFRNNFAAKHDWLHIKDLDLADPEFSAADPIDVLLGANVYANILSFGLRKGNRHEPVTHNFLLNAIENNSAEGKDQSTVIHQCTIGDYLLSCVNFGNRRSFLSPLCR